MGIFLSPYAQSFFGTLQSPPRIIASPSETQFCRLDWAAHVWAPTRLQLIDPCAKVTGTVVEGPTHEEHDGDVKLYISLDNQFAALTNEANREKLNGSLVVEVVAVDAPVVDVPNIGTHATFYGALVVDIPNGWIELHPTWTIQVLNVNVSLKNISNSTAVVQANVTQTLNETTTPIAGAGVFFELASANGQAVGWEFGRIDRSGLTQADFKNLQAGDYTLRVYARKLGSSGFSEFMFTMT